jgi:hypothetical protein
LPILDDENREPIEVFMLAKENLRYTAMGKPMGIDLNTVIEIVKLMKLKNPIDCIEKVILLSNEIIKNG